MFPVIFKKEQAQKYLECLNNSSNRKNISPEDIAGWTGDEILTLAGTCFLVMAQYGDSLRKVYAESIGQKLDLPEHPEHVEAVSEAISNDIHASIEFIGRLCWLIQNNKYDKNFDELLRFGATQEGQMQKTVVPDEGFKNNINEFWGFKNATRSD